MLHVKSEARRLAQFLSINITHDRQWLRRLCVEQCIPQVLTATFRSSFLLPGPSITTVASVSSEDSLLCTQTEQPSSHSDNLLLRLQPRHHTPLHLACSLRLGLSAPHVAAGKFIAALSLMQQWLLLSTLEKLLVPLGDLAAFNYTDALGCHAVSNGWARLGPWCYTSCAQDLTSMECITMRQIWLQLIPSVWQLV